MSRLNKVKRQGQGHDFTRSKDKVKVTISQGQTTRSRSRFHKVKGQGQGHDFTTSKDKVKVTILQGEKTRSRLWFHKVKTWQGQLNILPNKRKTQNRKTKLRFKQDKIKPFLIKLFFMKREMCVGKRENTQCGVPRVTASYH